MISLTGTVSGFRDVMGALNQSKGLIGDAVEQGVGRAMLGGQSIVRGKARGRPGPRSVTGDYNRSIVGDWAVSGDTVLGQIGTSSAQGRRLEFGFVGPDALGRVYNQGPLPHFQPSVPEVLEMTQDEVGKAVKGALG